LAGLSVVAFAAICAPLALIGAENPRAIVEEVQKRTTAKSHRYEGLLQVFDAKGTIADKRWSFERLGSHGNSKAILRFTAPAEVKGVALLVVNHPDRASDQWMWTPAIERDRRIALQDRSTRFFGTDFSFEDLEERDVDQFEYTLLGEESIDGNGCWKLQSTPKEAKSSQYTKSIVWIRKDRYTFERFENYIKDQVVRRLSYSDYQSVQGIWTARQMEMADLRRGSRTRLTLDKLAYDVPLKKRTSRCRRCGGNSCARSLSRSSCCWSVRAKRSANRSRSAGSSRGAPICTRRRRRTTTRRPSSTASRAKRHFSSRRRGFSSPAASTCAPTRTIRSRTPGVSTSATAPCSARASRSAG